MKIKDVMQRIMRVNDENNTNKHCNFSIKNRIIHIYIHIKCLKH